MVLTGAITDSATGRWFVYGDNISKASTIGGIVGTNISGKDLTTLVNCAAVRRYTRLSSDKNDDNTTNEHTGAKATRIEVHVGGIIGHQGNDRDDLWALSKCVNYGTVYNSRSNNIGGIVSYWTDYGGTIEYSFNFGDLGSVLSAICTLPKIPPISFALLVFVPFIEPWFWQCRILAEVAAAAEVRSLRR